MVSLYPLTYHNQLRRLDRLIHHLIDLLHQLLLGAFDHIDVRFGYRMLGNKYRTAVLKG